jgi:hypothetical protein
MPSAVIPLPAKRLKYLLFAVWPRPRKAHRACAPRHGASPAIARRRRARLRFRIGTAADTKIPQGCEHHGQQPGPSRFQLYLEILNLDLCTSVFKRDAQTVKQFNSTVVTQHLATLDFLGR